MSNATFYPSITVEVMPPVSGRWSALKELRDGLANAASEADVPEINRAINETNDDAHPGFLAWERDVVDAAVAEIAPQVADLLTAAIQRRLPWTWVAPTR